MMEYKVIKTAEFSPCGQYRYLLTREWDSTKPFACCVGLNPSTANSEKNDPTIRVLMGTLEKLGYGGLKMVNLYSCVTSKPNKIFDFMNPEVPHWSWIKTTAATCQVIIFCWGAFPHAVVRAKKMKDIFPDAKCFGKNKDGSPIHPMFLMWSGQLNDVKLIDYDSRNNP